MLSDELNKSWLQTFLIGVDQTDDDGVPFSDDIYDMAIDSAIDELSNDLHVSLDYTEYTFERKDSIDADAGGYYLMYLRHRPVREVTKLVAAYADFAPAQLPKSWVQISSEKIGQVQIMPGQESGSAHLIGQRLPLYGLTGNYGRPYTPRWWGFDYAAGFTDRRKGVSVGSNLDVEFNAYGHVTVKISVKPAIGETYTVTFTGEKKDDGSALTESVTFTNSDKLRKSTAGVFSTIDNITTATSGSSTPKFDIMTEYMMPEIFYKVIGITAAIPILDTAGDLILGAGIASQSTSVDSLSSSINTTSSPTNAGYGAKILSYTKQRKQIIKHLKRKWSMPKVSIV